MEAKSFGIEDVTYLQKDFIKLTERRAGLFSFVLIDTLLDF